MVVRPLAAVDDDDNDDGASDVAECTPDNDADAPVSTLNRASASATAAVGGALAEAVAAAAAKAVAAAAAVEAAAAARGLRPESTSWSGRPPPPAAIRETFCSTQQNRRRSN